MSNHSPDTYYTYDLGKLRGLYSRWESLFPDIQPHYAVKCNPNPEILRTLASCGASFDCASPSEIKAVLDANVAPSRILYANPCKREADIEYMAQCNVRLTTFDSACEIEKIARIAPATKCILRIYANDPTAQCILSNKFGAFPEEWDPLLSRAASLNISVVGVSFHVGSGACNPTVFRDALYQCKQVRALAKQYGYDLSVIDIGGGFNSTNVATMAKAIRDAREEMFGDLDNHIRFIAEPGRYFAETIGTLHTKIIGVRERRGTRDYFITDGLYGSFNCMLYDHSTPAPIPEVAITDDTEYMPSSIFGPTCDGFDKVIDSIPLPRMNYGDWIAWPNMGAYTIAGACDFNGINFTRPKCSYIGSEEETKIRKDPEGKEPEEKSINDKDMNE